MNRLFAVFSVLILYIYCFTGLAFVPVPWPDGSAFSLPGIDLFRFPPSWKMSSISDFVPSYELANFQTMPGLSVVLGFTHKVGLYDLLGGTLATKLLSVAVLLGAGGLLLRWTGSWIAVMALVLDPSIRWGTLVVRTEVWVALFAIILMKSLKPAAITSRGLWWVSASLAGGAIFHFNAIVLVLPALVGLWPGNSPGVAQYFRNLTTVGLRTLLLLSPWWIFALFHWSEFWQQMDIQFHRLDVVVSSPAKTFYSLIHSPFQTLGSPISWPKFFNVGKAIFWALGLLLTFRAMLRRKSRYDWAHCALFWASMYLWITKPEVWFSVLPHFFLWIWVAFHQKQKIVSILTCGYLFISMGVLGVQWFQIPRLYSWNTYQKWIDCIDQGIPNRSSKIWQPFAPDALIDLQVRNPQFKLTRTLDFQITRPELTEIARRFDVILFSTYLSEGSKVFAGAPRDEDRARIDNEFLVPMGQMSHDLSGEMKICHVGPFWASTLVRSPAGSGPSR